MALCVALIWGFNFVPVKFAFDQIPPLRLGFIRYILSSLPILFFIKRPHVPFKYLAGYGVALGFFKFSCLFGGVALGMSSGLAALLLQTQVFFTLLLSYFIFKAPITKRHWAGMIFAFCGVYLMALNIDHSFSETGFILVLGAAISWAVSNILLKKMGSVDMFALIVWSGMIPIPLYLITSWYFEGPMTLANMGGDWTLRTHMCVIFIAWVSTWVGATLWARLIQIHSPERVAPYSLFMILFAVISGWIFFDEIITKHVLFACSLVLTGLIIHLYPFKKRTPQYLDEGLIATLKT